MFNQIIVVHFKLKFKLMEKGLVPKQIALFQIQPETECVQPSALRVNVEGDLSSLAGPHTGGTSSAWGIVESGVLAPHGCLTQTPGTCRGKSELTEAACTPNTHGKMITELKGGWSRPSAREGNYSALCKDMRLSLHAPHSSTRPQCSCCFFTALCPVCTVIRAVNQLNSFIVLCCPTPLQWQVQDKLCGAEQVWFHCQFPFLVILLLA